jgi:RNA polymerase sigma-70 factor (ECF subfamily)
MGVNVSPTTFHELYSRYADEDYRFAFWLCGNPHDAQDLTSETFARAWSATAEPRAETVKAYLFTITRNLYRKQGRQRFRSDLLDEALPDGAAQPDEAAINRDDLCQALQVIQSLPEPDRTVLLLRAEKGMSYHEIAAQTGLSVVAAKVKVFRARARICSQLISKEEL